MILCSGLAVDRRFFHPERDAFGAKGADRLREGAMPECCNVLVVEDEALIALDLAMTIEEMGAVVCGPFNSVDRAAPTCDTVDGAILDVDIKGGTVFALADRLHAKGTPMVFHTGRSDVAGLRARYGESTPILRKPARMDQLRLVLSALIDKRRYRWLATDTSVRMHAAS